MSAPGLSDPPADPRASGDVRQFTVAEDDDGVRLDRWFRRHLPQVSFAMVSRWARTGQIRVDGKRVRPEDRLSPGQVLRVPPGGEPEPRAGPARRTLSEQDRGEAQGMVILDTPAALVLNKPPGLATQGGTRTSRHVDGLLDAFLAEGAPRPRLVHRLDKDTSGALLIAKTPGSAAFFSRRFSGRSAKKVYWALVVGVPEVRAGTIDAPLAKQPGSGGEKMHVDHENGQAAKTRYRVVETAGQRAAWVELEPLTGRTHQLRVHCAAMGNPIVGDGKYGGQDAFLTGSISRKMHLHARRLIIDAPPARAGGAKQVIDAVAELPEHFAASMAQLGFDLNLTNADPLDDSPPERTALEKKQAARQHAKLYRKERRGERRGRRDTTAKTDAAGPGGSRSRPPGKTARPGSKTGGARPAKGAPRAAPRPPKGPAR